MRDLYALAISEKEANRRAEEWLSSVDKTAMVGSRHHIVPRVHLERFANSRDQLLVRDRTTGVASRRAIRDLAVKDFYTTANEAGQLDSTFESLLSVIEGAAAEVIRSHLDLDSFASPRPIRDDERLKLDTYTAAQAVRGMRVRRQHELIVDYGIKLTNRGNLSDEELRDLSFVPHQNDHVKIFKELAEAAFLRLADRPAFIVKLDSPLFVISDEPVALIDPGEPMEGSSGAFSRTSGGDQGLIHFSSPGRRAGIDGAEEVVLPLSPRAALVYGARGTRASSVSLPFRLYKAEASEAAEEVNALQIENAIDWVAAHPSHPTFRGLSFSAPRPLVQIEDGGSSIAQQTGSDRRRRPHRLWKS